MIIRELIAAYKSHKHSPYQKLRPRGRKNADYLLGRLLADCGGTRLSVVKAGWLIGRYDTWSSGGVHIDMAHTLVTMLRRLFGFGFTFLENKQCDRLCRVMAEMPFKKSPARTEIVTPAQAIAIRAEAHRVGRPSIALAQAGMTDFGWRQGDMIGTYEERGAHVDVSDIVVARWGQYMGGARWEALGDDMVLRHVTSKKQKLSEPPIMYAPMILAELRALYCPNGEPLTRDRLPASGPMILNEATGLPYHDRQFRYEWRKIARAAGVPDNVQNRDSRAGRATHALSIGVPLNRVRQMLGHTKIDTTAIYLRDQEGETAAAMKQIAESVA